MGAFKTFFFFFFFEGVVLIGPSSIFFETLGTPQLIEEPLWTASHKIEINALSMPHLFSLYA